MPIPKGSVMYIAISGLHNDISQYVDPHMFIPDRFNPESKYYFANSVEADGQGDLKKKTRDVHSFMTFGAGPRSCPGMSMANFELKVLTAYFVLKFKHEVDQEQINNENIRFALFSQFDLKLKITEIIDS